MQEVFEKILEKLGEEIKKNTNEDRTYRISFFGLDIAREIVKQVAKEYNNGWIPCSERFPEDCDNRFYMCIVENHEEDLPMYCQYDEDYGFGFWHDIYDEHTLGFVDSEFKTNEELGYEKVIAWQPLPEPYQSKGSNYMEHDGCKGCKYEHCTEDSEQCKGCKQNAVDKYARMTNADRISAMSVDEMTEFIVSLNDCCLAGTGVVDCRYANCEKDCSRIVKNWLQSEVDEKG